MKIYTVILLQLYINFLKLGKIGIYQNALYHTMLLYMPFNFLFIIFNLITDYSGTVIPQAAEPSSTTSRRLQRHPSHSTISAKNLCKHTRLDTCTLCKNR